MNEQKRILHKMVKHVKASAEDPFTPLLDMYLVKRLQSDVPRLETHVDLRPRHRPGKRLSPSSIGGCQRAAVFSFAGLRGAKKINPDTELIFENGDWVHHKFQSLFCDMELVLGKDLIEVAQIEEKVSLADLYITGHLDIRVKVKIDGKMRWVVIDVKSINDRGYSVITANGAADPKHVQQVTTYCKLAGVKYGCLLYENKNTNQIMFFVFKVKEKVWGKVELWCKEVIQTLNDRKLPQRDPDCQQGNFNYERCAYKGLCYGDLDRVQLKKMTYKDFPGVVALWEAGLREEARAMGDETVF